MSTAFGFYKFSTFTGSDESAPPGPAAVTFLHNVLSPALVCLDKGGEGEGAAAALSPTVVAARRRACLTYMARCPFVVDGMDDLSGDHYAVVMSKVMNISIAVGAMLDLSLRDAMRLMDAVDENSDAAAGGFSKDPYTPPAAVHMMQMSCEGVGTDQLKPFAWVPTDPFLGPIWRKRCCLTCGLIPEDPAMFYKACSLCLDPSVGRFCCKDPCFAAFWKGGHKNECAGRDKQMKKKKESKGG
jgi:hypothetical protein